MYPSSGWNCCCSETGRLQGPQLARVPATYYSSMSSNTPLNRVIHSFGAELCSFAGRVSSSVNALKHAVEKPPYAGVQDFKETLEDLEQRVADLTHESQVLERHSVDSLSVEELVAHWTILHQVVQHCIGKLEAHLQQYGYDAPAFQYQATTAAEQGLPAGDRGGLQSADVSPARDRSSRRLSRSLPCSPATKLTTAIKAAHARSRLGHSQPGSPFRLHQGAPGAPTAVAGGTGGPMAGAAHRPSLDSHASLTPQAVLSPGLAAKYGSSTGGSSLPMSLPSGTTRNFASSGGSTALPPTPGPLGASPDVPTFPQLSSAMGSATPDTPDLSGLSLGPAAGAQGERGGSGPTGGWAGLSPLSGGEDTTGELYSSLIKSSLRGPGPAGGPPPPASPPAQLQQQQQQGEARTPKRPGTPGSTLRGPTLPPQWHQQKLQELDSMHLALSQLKRTPSRAASRACSSCSTPHGLEAGGGEEGAEGVGSPCVPEALFGRLDAVAADMEVGEDTGELLPGVPARGLATQAGEGGCSPWGSLVDTAGGAPQQQQPRSGVMDWSPAGGCGPSSTAGQEELLQAPGSTLPLDTATANSAAAAASCVADGTSMNTPPAPGAAAGGGGGGGGGGTPWGLSMLSPLSADGSPLLSTPVSTAAAGGTNSHLPVLTPGTTRLLKSARGVFELGRDTSARPKSSIRRPLPCTDLNRLKQAAQQRLQQNPGPVHSLLQQQEEAGATQGEGMMAHASSSAVAAGDVRQRGSGASRAAEVAGQHSSQQEQVEERVLQPLSLRDANAPGNPRHMQQQQKLRGGGVPAAAGGKDGLQVTAPLSTAGAGAAEQEGGVALLQVDEEEYEQLPAWCRRQVPLADLNALLQDMHRAGTGACFVVADLVRLGCTDTRAKAVINCLSKMNKVELQSGRDGNSVCRLCC